MKKLDLTVGQKNQLKRLAPQLRERFIAIGKYLSEAAEPQKTRAAPVKRSRPETNSTRGR
jgi:hypothetical protein